MIDVSDGLSSELLHICNGSNTGCVLYEDKIPVHDDTRAMALQFQLGTAACALSGGEDYELLFTIRQEDYERVTRNPDITVIGYVTEKSEGTHLHTKRRGKTQTHHQEGVEFILTCAAVFWRRMFYRSVGKMDAFFTT